MSREGLFDMIGRDPTVSKANQLHVDTFHFFIVNLR